MVVKTIVISDGGHRFVVQLKEDVDLPDLPEEEPAHLRFMQWWREEAKRANIPYSFRVSEPQGHKIIQNLLRTHTIEELKKLAVHFFLDYGERLRNNPYHYAIFSSLIEHMEGELKGKEI